MTWQIWDDEAGEHVAFVPAVSREQALAMGLVETVTVRTYPNVERGELAQWAADVEQESAYASRAWIARRVRGYKLAGEILDARDRAHAKHGDDSIESIPADDPRWLAVLVEEIGEVAHALTYDSVDRDVYPDETDRLRIRRRILEAELVDVLAVAAAWLDASRTSREPVDTTRSDAEAANDTRPTS